MLSFSSTIKDKNSTVYKKTTNIQNSLNQKWCLVRASYYEKLMEKAALGLLIKSHCFDFVGDLAHKRKTMNPGIKLYLSSFLRHLNYCFY